MLWRIASLSLLLICLTAGQAQAEVLVTSNDARKTAAKLGWQKVKILSDRSLLYSGSTTKAEALAGVMVESNDRVRLAVAPSELSSKVKQSYWQYRNDWSGSGQINSPLAWNYSLGEGQVVAVVDSGVNFQSSDLASRRWNNPGEIADGLDNDGNGIVDDLHGARLNQGSRLGDSGDGVGHGTSVASLVAASANNGGVVGAAPAAQIMSVRIMDDRGVGDEADLVAGIDYAVAEGAKILNLSLVSDSPSPSPAIQAAIDEAGRQNALVVIAAGNSGRDIDARPIYPAALSGDNIVSVGASDKDDKRASFSNFGKANVDIFAPGDSLFALNSTGSISIKSGTSLAAPLVSGSAALLRARNPALTATTARQALLSTVDKKSSLTNLAASGGRLNAGRAVESVGKLKVVTLSSPARDGVVLSRKGGKVTVKFKANSSATYRLYLDGKIKLKTSAKSGSRVSKSLSASRGKHLLRITTGSGPSSVAISRTFSAK